MKVTAILKGRKDQNGHLPIQIRVNRGERRTFHPTGLKVAKDQFAKGRVKNHPKTAEYNKEIERLIIIHQAANVEGLQRKQKKVDFYRFLQQCIDKWENTKGDGTMRIYRSLFNLLKEFQPQLYLHELDLAFLDAWKAYRAKQVEDTTAWSNFTKLKAVVNEALKQKLISESPFEHFVMPEYDPGIPVYLEKDELQAIENKLPDLGRLAHYGWWFLIASHTGFRVGDIVSFDPKKHIRKERIVVHTDKEGVIVSLPFTDRLKNCFEKINYAPLGCSEETYREKIKTIALAAGVTKDISTHTARHTAAVNMASAGLSIEVVAKILGHKSLRSTAVYYQIVNKKVEDDYRAFDEYMNR